MLRLHDEPQPFIQSQKKNDTINGINSDHICYRRYDVRSIPEDFLKTDLNIQYLVKIIEDIENCKAIQRHTNTQNETSCNFYHNEMKNWFKYHNAHPTACKRLKMLLDHFGTMNLKNYGLI